MPQCVKAPFSHELLAFFDPAATQQVKTQSVLPPEAQVTAPSH